jgi:anthranilate phosphoribosyltransferase
LILIGEATSAQLGAFLMGLRLRGETVEEIAGATRAMRAAMIPVAAPLDAIDIVGTGGDGASTWNISTLAAIIAAAAGATVAKHGGKASSSRSGASDVLGELGVRVGRRERLSARNGHLFHGRPHPSSGAGSRRASASRTGGSHNL